jgi:hypothetical protein
LNRTPNTTNKSKNKPMGLHQTDQQTKALAGYRWLMPIIVVTQELETKRIEVQCQHRQIVCETYLESLNTRKGWQSGSSGASKHEALSSNSNTAKNEKGQRIEYFSEDKQIDNRYEQSTSVSDKCKLKPRRDTILHLLECLLLKKKIIIHSSF